MRPHVGGARERRCRCACPGRRPVQVGGEIGRPGVRARSRAEPLGGEARARRIGRAGFKKEDIGARIEGHWAPSTYEGWASVLLQPYVELALRRATACSMISASSLRSLKRR